MPYFELKSLTVGDGVGRGCGHYLTLQLTGGFIGEYLGEYYRLLEVGASEAQFLNPETRTTRMLWRLAHDGMGSLGPSIMSRMSVSSSYPAASR